VTDLERLADKVDALVDVLTQNATAPRSPWMTPAETCQYLRWVHETDTEGHKAGDPNLDLFYTARKRYGLPATKVGGSLRCHRQFVDEWARTGVAVRDLRAVGGRGRRG
jgi:hypothetical protein